jgi:translocator protein
MEFDTPLAVAAAVAIVTMGLGGWLTDVGPWYRSLKTPAWKPPDWAFGPIWTTIIIATTIAAVMTWKSATPAQQPLVLTLFLLNAALNVFWNILYFTFRRPDWALLEVVVFWLSIAALIYVVWPINQTAGLLLVPYLVWVTIASVLNREVVRLNPWIKTGIKTGINPDGSGR